MSFHRVLDSKLQYCILTAKRSLLDPPTPPPTPAPSFLFFLIHLLGDKGSIFPMVVFNFNHPRIPVAGADSSWHRRGRDVLFFQAGCLKPLLMNNRKQFTEVERKESSTVAVTKQNLTQKK